MSSLHSKGRCRTCDDAVWKKNLSENSALNVSRPTGGECLYDFNCRSNLKPRFIIIYFFYLIFYELRSSTPPFPSLPSLSSLPAVQRAPAGRSGAALPGEAQPGERRSAAPPRHRGGSPRSRGGEPAPTYLLVHPGHRFTTARWSLTTGGGDEERAPSNRERTDNNQGDIKYKFQTG